MNDTPGCFKQAQLQSFTLISCAGKTMTEIYICLNSGLSSDDFLVR